MEVLPVKFSHDKGDNAFVNFDYVVIGKGRLSNRGATSQKPEGYSMLIRYSVSKDAEGNEVIYKGEYQGDYDESDPTPVLSKVSSKLTELKQTVEQIGQKRKQIAELRAERKRDA